MRWEVVDSVIVDELPCELVVLLTEAALAGDFADPLDILIALEEVDDLDERAA